MNNRNMNETARIWAEIVLKMWENTIAERHIGKTNVLVNSLYFHVHSHANGNPERIDFFFEYYGKFVDMGVGKHVSLEDQDSLRALGRNNRKKKPWFSEIFYWQVNRLREIMAEKYAEKAAITVVSYLNSDIISTK